MSKKDKNALAVVRKQRCLVCGSFPTEVDHIKTRGSGGGNEWENLWSLCRVHHMEKHALGLTSFVERYPKLEAALLARGWYFDDFQKKWRRTGGTGEKK